MNRAPKMRSHVSSNCGTIADLPCFQLNSGYDIEHFKALTAAYRGGDARIVGHPETETPGRRWTGTWPSELI
jgi:hypothetical protein